MDSAPLWFYCIFVLYIVSRGFRDWMPPRGPSAQFPPTPLGYRWRLEKIPIRGVKSPLDVVIS